jgi:hypothetical protein
MVDKKFVKLNERSLYISHYNHRWTKNRTGKRIGARGNRDFPKNGSKSSSMVEIRRAICYS